MYKEFIEKYETKVEKNIWKNFVEVLDLKNKKFDYKAFEQIEIEKINEISLINIEKENLESKGKVLYDSDDENYTIKIDYTNPMEVQLFTVAHEVGHILLHNEKLKEDGELESNYKKDEIYSSNIEIEANAFAIELLEPIIDLLAFKKEELKGYDEKNPLYADDFIKMCAKRYKVSYLSTKYRLENVGIIRR